MSVARAAGRLPVRLPSVPPLTKAPTMYSPPKAVSRSRIPIIPRRMKLDFGDVDRPFPFADNSIMSTMFATLSGVFPPGEKEFIQSVRNYMAEIHDEELLRQVKLFATQEGHHALQHRAVNTMLDSLGYTTMKVADMVAEQIAIFQTERSDADRLAVTVVMEHYTAALAHFALAHPEHFDSLPASIRELIFWHAIEEIEHKSVAFDVYEHCVGERPRLRKWLLIQLVMFPLAVARLQRGMLADIDHRPTAREFVEAGRFLLGPGGMLPTVIPQYLAMLRSDFHPWDLDDSDLVDAWKRELSTQ